MSLHHAAQHLAKQGRNGDSMLVHMTPGEVSGLQTLLQAKGRTLTINPHTGLPEAWLGSDLGGSLWDAGKGVTSGIGGAVQDLTSSPIGAMLVGAALVAAGVPPQFAGLATGAASYASGNSFKQSVGAGLAGQGGGSFADAQGWAGAEGSTGPSSSIPVTEPGGAVPAPVSSAPVVDQTAIQAQPVPPVETAPVTATPTMAPETQAVSDRQLMNSASGYGEYMPNASAYDQGMAAASGSGTTAAAPTGFMDKLSGYYDAAGQWVSDNPKTALASAAGLGALTGGGAQQQQAPQQPAYEGAYIRPYVYDPQTRGLRQLAPVKAPVKAASGGMMSGGPVERMANANSVGANTGYPMADINQGAYAMPWQTPVSRNVVADASDTGVDSFTGEPRGMAGGGISDLGSYSDGGRLLKGPGDGVSDSIPAEIGGKQPARLADGEFVVPARIVSELGNGSTDAGARQLYQMMDRIQAARGKTVGKDKVATNTRAAKHLPA